MMKDPEQREALLGSGAALKRSRPRMGANTATVPGAARPGAGLGAGASAGGASAAAAAAEVPLDKEEAKAQRRDLGTIFRG